MDDSDIGLQCLLCVVHGDLYLPYINSSNNRCTIYFHWLLATNLDVSNSILRKYRYQKIKMHFLHPRSTQPV